MFTVTTAEIRWFLPGHPDQGLWRWLQSLEGSCEEQPPRDDLYLVSSGQEGLGIKQREGRMEFKKRLKVHPDYEIGPVRGKPESWIKWSIQLAEEIPAGDPHFALSGHWITVSKKRFLQKYKIGTDGSLIMPPSEGYPARGITVELSELTVKGVDWWTIGIECFGPADEVYDLLLASVHRLLEDPPAATLLLADSMGYPEWIGLHFP